MLNRISILKDKMLSQPRFVSIEQALIITRTYQENEDKSIPYKRALSLYNALKILMLLNPSNIFNIVVKFFSTQYILNI